MIIFVDAASRSLRRTFAGELRWPIEFILGYYHKKQVFDLNPNRLPRIPTITQALSNFTNRLRWQVVLNEIEDFDVEEWWKSASQKAPHIVRQSCRASGGGAAEL